MILRCQMAKSLSRFLALRGQVLLCSTAFRFVIGRSDLLLKLLKNFLLLGDGVHMTILLLVGLQVRRADFSFVPGVELIDTILLAL